MHLVPPYSSMFAWVLFLFVNSDSIIQPIRLTDDGDRQEDEDPKFVDVLESVNDEGKSSLPSLPSCLKPPKC